jgi:hypothetical protein
MITSSKCRPRNNAGRFRITINPTKSRQSRLQQNPIERARELLAVRIADLPIWIRRHRTLDGATAGAAWNRVCEYQTCVMQKAVG